MRDNGVRCITFPCPSLTQYILNSKESSSLSGISFDKTLDAAIVEWARTKIYAQEIVVVAGTYETITGPAGEGTALVVNQIYRPVAAATPAPPCGTISQVGESCGGGPLPDPCMARKCAEGLVCYQQPGLFDAPGAVPGSGSGGLLPRRARPAQVCLASLRRLLGEPGEQEDDDVLRRDSE